MSNHIFPVITEEMLKLPLHVSGVGFDYIESGINREKGYPSYQWVQCQQGEGLLHYHGKKISISPDNGIFINKNDPHAYFPAKEPWITSWLSFDGPGLHSILDMLGLNTTTVYIVKNKGFLLNMIHHMYKRLNSSDSLKHVDSSSYMYYFLTLLVKNISNLDMSSHYNRFTRLDPILTYINENYPNPLTIETLSELIQVSPQYLCSLFREYLGQRPFEYLNLVRINKSKELLVRDADATIGHICSSVGFEHPSYFGKVFRKIVGMTPGQFKHLHHM